MDLGQAVRAATQRQRQAGSYLGTVTAIDAGSAALTIDIGTGVPLTGVRWVGSYAPTVNGFVTVLRSGSAWTVLGKLSKDLRVAGPVRGSTTLAPAAWWRASAAWYGPGETSGWSWEAGAAMQGQTGAPPDMQVWGGAMIYPPLSSALPAGATIESARVSLTRDWDDGTLTPRYPRIYGYTDSGPTGAAGPSAAFLAGYGPWSPGTLVQGETGSWALPSTWITALLAGTLQGVALYSQAAVDAMRFTATAPITITYRL